MRKTNGLLIGLLGLGLFLLATASQAATTNPGGSGYLDTIAGNFQSATTGWMTTAQGYALHIFASLAVLDLAWWGIKNILKKNDLADFIGGATLKISSIFFFYTIVSYAPTWMPLITSSFMQMGQGIGGAAGATTPSGIMSEAFSVISTLWTTVEANTGWDHLGNSVLFALVAVVTSVFGLIGFGLVALQLFMTQIEMYLVGGAGLVMLGFTGSGMTSSFGEKYIGYMISIGIKLLVIYAIVGLGQNVINSEIAYINAWTSATPPLDLLSVGATMLIYGVIGMQVPGLAGSLMNGSPNMSLGNVAGGAAAIAGGVAAAGAAAVAGAAGAAQGLAKMADLVGAGAGGAAGAGAGGIGGAESLAAMSSMTGSASSAGATSAGIGDATGAAASQSAGAGSTAAPPSVSAPASGATDALGAGTQSGSGTTGAGSEDAASQGKNHWKAMGDQLGNLASKKDDIARHEGSTGGIQIRLNHTE
ncbi:P-type conjugative transfer protein TrbL [Ferrovum myxofaciens]|uniref:P-type conjugative transfer protein TrbL n=1 Tax=Ferrovum myxofaciens TaxID=416213 RepID=UPI0004E22A30|nr:P-type conjugative transfer protein TrbL [Ferrovum myxofaciens]